MSHHTHTSTSFLLMLAALFLPLASFGGDGNSSSTNASVATPATIAGSCNNPASGFCNEFTGSSYKAARVKRACKGQGVVFLAGACPTEGGSARALCTREGTMNQDIATTRISRGSAPSPKAGLPRPPKANAPNSRASGPRTEAEGDPVRQSGGSRLPQKPAQRDRDAGERGGHVEGA